MIKRKAPDKKRELQYGMHIAASCPICKHPQRLEMQRAYVNWQTPKLIAQSFNLEFPYAQAWVASHMEVCGFRDKRRKNANYAAELILERGVEKSISAAEVIAAASYISKTDAESRWIDKQDVTFDGKLEIQIVNYKKGDS